MTRPSAGGLDAKTVALVRAAAALAEGKIAELKQRFVAARAAGVPDLWVEELLLQSLLVVGYPLTLVAFAAWRELAGPLPVAGDGEGGGGGVADGEGTAGGERGGGGGGGGYGGAHYKLVLHLR